MDLGPFENDKQTKFQNLLGSRSVLLTRQISQYAHYATPERYASVLLANNCSAGFLSTPHLKDPRSLHRTPFSLSSRHGS